MCSSFRRYTSHAIGAILNSNYSLAHDYQHARGEGSTGRPAAAIAAATTPCPTPRFVHQDRLDNAVVAATNASRAAPAGSVSEALRLGGEGSRSTRMKPFKAAVIGGSGYGANEIIRRLLLHPRVELVRVASIDYVGQLLSAAHPNLTGQTKLRFEKLSPEEAAAGMDVVLLGLPHTVSSTFVPRLLKTDVKHIIDLSGDFRLRDVTAYEQFYTVAHPCPELLAQAVYGLPELNRERIAGARLVASPGCFATATELSLLALAKANLLHGPVRTVAVTGSSGSGAAAKPTTHHPTRAKNLRTYKPLSHQHVPEIVQTLRAAGARDLRLEMVPISAPLTRGIFVTSFVTLPAEVIEERISQAFVTTFTNERFVRIPEGRFPEVAAVSGSNYVEVGYWYGPATADERTVMCFAAIDNLIKGGAGQAVQSMNIALGLDETLTLRDAGGYP